MVHIKKKKNLKKKLIKEKTSLDLGAGKECLPTESFS